MCDSEHVQPEVVANEGYYVEVINDGRKSAGFILTVLKSFDDDCRWDLVTFTKQAGCQEIEAHSRTVFGAVDHLDIIDEQSELPVNEAFAGISLPIDRRDLDIPYFYIAASIQGHR